MGIILNPKVTTWGLGAFVLTSDTPAGSGLYPQAAITGHAGDPTFKVNGVSIASGSAKIDDVLWHRACVLYQLQCGSVDKIVMARGALKSYTAPVAVADSASVSKGLVISSGVLPMLVGVLSYTVRNPGSGYPSAFFGNISGGTFTNCASALFRASGGQITSIVPYAAHAFGHGNGYTGNFSGTTPQGAPGSGCTFDCTVGNYITCVPVISGGSGFVGKPTITISDTGGGTGTGAVAFPHMTGPASSDTVTYSAPANWLTAGAFSLPAATNQPMFNYAGRLEGKALSLPGFDIAPKMQATIQHPTQATYFQEAATSTCKDKLNSGGPWQGANVQVDAMQNPLSWDAGGTINSAVYLSINGYFDVYKAGPWIIKYRDAFHAGETTATTTMTLVTNRPYTFGSPTTTVNGAIVTVTYEATYNWFPSIPIDPAMSIYWQSSDGLNHVTHPNNPNIFRPLVMAPGNTDNGLFYDMDDVCQANIVRNGVAPAFMRFMDLNFSYGGKNHFSTIADRIPTNLSSWSATDSSSSFGKPDYVPGFGKVVVFTSARFYNSNPAHSSTGDGTYPWPASTKVYNYGCIPTGQDATGFYLNVADGPNGADDNGQIVLGSNINQQGIVELRTTQAGGHGLQTGQWCEIDPANGTGYTVPWTIRGNVTTFTAGGIQLPVFVTGPDTVAISWGFSSAAGPGSADTVNSHTEVPVVLNFVLRVPLGAVAPLEYHCGVINRLPGADLYHNAPQLGTTQHDMTGYHYLDGYTAGTNLGPTHGVRFELNNEFWNSGNTYTCNWLPIQAKFNRYAPTGAPTYGGFLTGGVDLGSATPTEVFAAAQAFEAFAAGWAAAGRSRSQLKHYIGAQWTDFGIASFIASNVHLYGIQCDAVMVAPYADLGLGTIYPSYLDAYYPAGLNGDPASVESWPVYQLNDLFSYAVAYSTYYQTVWNGYTSSMIAAGIPLACYEGGYDQFTPDGLPAPFYQYVTEDMFNHPSFWHAVRRYLVWQQLGDWTTYGTVGGGGAVAASWFVWCGGGAGAPGNPTWKIPPGWCNRLVWDCPIRT